MDILTELTDFDYKKRSYLKNCLKLAEDHNESTTDRRNAKDTRDYINELEIAVMRLNSDLLKHKDK